MGSRRLPGKPLVPVLGRPLLEWVWRRAARMDVFSKLVVATDSREIMDACTSFGAPSILTSHAHPSGTDRVAEVARHPGFSGFDVVVNLQGDEPLARGVDVSAAVALASSGDWDIGTCVTPLTSPDELGDPSVVKVARTGDGRALYFSRAPVPWRREAPGGEDASTGSAGPWRHLGIYACTPSALRRWAGHPPSALERLEGLEQLRALEAGLRIGTATVPPAPPGVDTPSDVARLEAILGDRASTPLA